MRRFSVLALFFWIMGCVLTQAVGRQMEYLDRGVVAVKITNGVFLSWRLLGTDNPATAFNLYRNDVLLTTTPLTDRTNYLDAGGSLASVYKVVPVVNNVALDEAVEPVKAWTKSYLSLRLNRPKGGVTEPNQTGSVGKVGVAYPNGQPYRYVPNDCSVGDLDGDGEYEIVVKWDPTNAQDNSYYGITGKVYLDAYKLDGTQLWRIDLGKNIRAGAHYTQFLVYDFDGDGLAELVCKTAPGTVDGLGANVIMGNDNPNADYRSLTYTATSGSGMLGTIQKGPEYLTLFNGKTGAEQHTIAYNPVRGTVSSWGDSYANRADRFLACVAYLDGQKPSAVMCRGYYAKTTLTAYDVVDRKLVQRWLYNSGTTAGVGAYGQGNHNLSVADVDADGKDEIIYGACAIDDNGALLYRTGHGHGDAMHVSDIDPETPGLEVWTVHEDKASAYGYELHEAGTGKVLWGTYTGSDVGRGLSADIDARYSGLETWSTASGVLSCKGATVSTKRPSVNFRIYWDGDLQDELLDGTVISKWNGSGTNNLLTPSGVGSCNSTKKTPNLSADLFGDWREELVLWSTADSSQLNIYTTTTTSSHRLFTLMHDPVYRLGVAWQNVAYNQPPHLGFYIGDGLAAVQQPAITTVKYNPATQLNQPVAERTRVYTASGQLFIEAYEPLIAVTLYSMAGRQLCRADHLGQTSFSTALPKGVHLLLVTITTASGSEMKKVAVL